MTEERAAVQSKTPEELYAELIERVKKYHPSDDISLIEKAYLLAAKAHEGQLRRSGEPYITHPLQVALILAELELDKESIAAGILHDVVEDTGISMQAIEQEFGKDVALLVDGVTKLQQLPMEYHGGGSLSHDKNEERLELQAENLRKMFLAMAKDIRVILIKLADRLHNMRTLRYQPPEKQKRIARETLDIYSPLAERLGIARIQIELDDLSLKYLEPDIYYELVEKISARKSEREAFINRVAGEIENHLREAGIKNAQIYGRAKHFFSIYKKMVNRGKSLDQIYDLFAVRIIVETVKDCYGALGVIHEMYKPIPGRFKDYIAMPKANMYQSLHTTLIGSDGRPFEVQIRTYDMHRAAEYGIAAHWKYKEASDGKGAGKDEEEAKLAWLRQILEWQQDMSDNREFLSLLKDDLNLFSDKVYCFTPGGDVKNLPAGSTPIDFAYSIHSAVGNKMIGARVNGRLVTIDYEIKNGDRIEILTSQNSKGPSRDWLSIVKSTQAKSKINQWFKAERREDNIERGKEAVNTYCRARGIELSALMEKELVDRVVRKYGFSDWNSILAAIGHGGLKEGQIVNKLRELYEETHKRILTNEEVLQSIEDVSIRHTPSPRSGSGIIVKGIADISVRFSKCCSPVPGDEIVGFVTRGRGVSIHRTDCVNIVNLPEFDRVRLIEAEWQEGSDEGEEKYVAEIRIYAADRPGLLADISRTMTEKGISIQSLNTRTNKRGQATLDMTFETGGREELRNIIDKLRNIESVQDIERTSG